MTKRERTAAEFVESLQSDPKWVRENAERQQARSRLQAANRLAEAPLVEELSAEGIEVNSVWDLVNRRAPYAVAVPILLKHLLRPYPERVREGIARALAVAEANSVWPIIAEAFRMETDTSTSGIKWALSCALGAAGTDNEMEQVIAFLRDASLGRNRVPLLNILARSSSGPAARKILGELQKDRSIVQDVNRALRQLNRRPKNR